MKKIAFVMVMVCAGFAVFAGEHCAGCKIEDKVEAKLYHALEAALDAGRPKRVLLASAALSQYRLGQAAARKRDSLTVTAELNKVLMNALNSVPAVCEGLVNHFKPLSNFPTDMIPAEAAELLYKLRERPITSNEVIRFLQKKEKLEAQERKLLKQKGSV